jgi:hypothetical protein
MIRCKVCHSKLRKSDIVIFGDQDLCPVCYFEVNRNPKNEKILDVVFKLNNPILSCRCLNGICKLKRNTFCESLIPIKYIDNNGSIPVEQIYHYPIFSL